MTSPHLSKLSFRMLIGILIYILYAPLALFLASGDLGWWQAWLYSLLAIGLNLISRVLVVRKHPDLAAERAAYREAEGTKAWDRKLMPWVSIFAPLLMLVVAGLDHRFDWSAAIAVQSALLALLIAALGFVFSTWALLENRYFSAVVRIQNERGHTVCSSGPYRYLRHPGYAGAILWYLMTPLILGSWWTYIPTVIAVGLVILRTVLEDRTLQAELPGYREYARQTRYRLMPGLW